MAPVFERVRGFFAALLAPPNSKAVRITLVVGIGLGFAFVTLQSLNYLITLYDESEREASKSLKVITSLLGHKALDLEFLPQEFTELTPDSNGFYRYPTSPGAAPLFFRRSPTSRSEWQWSEDGRRWLSCSSFTDASSVLDPPTVIFLHRLALESELRKRAAEEGSAASRRHFPAPLSLAGSARPLDSAPEVLCCPISQHIMREPVLTPSGQTFERECIHKWVSEHNTDPTTGAPLTEDDLMPNRALREIIERWLGQHHGGDPSLVALS